MSQSTTKTALVRRSHLSIALDGGKGRAGTCKTEAEWERQVEAVRGGGYEIIDLDARDIANGRPLPSKGRGR